MNNFNSKVFNAVMQEHLPGVDTHGFPYEKIANDYHEQMSVIDAEAGLNHIAITDEETKVILSCLKDAMKEFLYGERFCNIANSLIEILSESAEQ